MKRYLRPIISLFTIILAVILSTSATYEKTYIVHPLTSTPSSKSAPKFVIVNETQLNDMLKNGLVDWYEEDTEGTLLGVYTSDDYDECYTESYPKYELDVVRANHAWKKGFTGKNIKIAVIDSGIDTEHFEFEHIGGGKDYTNTGIDDTLSHGTQVTGMIAAAHNGAGIMGIAPNALIIPLKVTNSETVQSSTVADAIIDAVDTYDCDIINLSLAFPSDNATLKSAIDYAFENGVIIIAAVGNYTSANENGQYIKDDSLSYPAAYDNVIGVGSVHRLFGFDARGNKISPFSKNNSSVFISAPGERVFTTTLVEKGYFNYAYGTSLAAPMVSGAAALLLNANPSLTPTEIATILANSATDGGVTGYDTSFGNGIMDVASAIELALSKNVLAPKTISFRVTAADELLNDAISVDGYAVGDIGSYETDTSFTATAIPLYNDGTNNYSFSHWVNGSNSYISNTPTYTFTPTESFTLRAVYDKVPETGADNQKKAEFWNGNGTLVDVVLADENGKIPESSIPTEVALTGYVFDKWINEDSTTFDATLPLAKPLSRIVAQYNDSPEVFTATFDDVPESQICGKYGEKVSYTAMGDEFDYWLLDGKIFSYNQTLSFSLWKDITLTAVYNAVTHSSAPAITLTNDESGAFFITYSVPMGYEPIGAGILFGTGGSTPRINSFHSKASVKSILSFGQFTALPAMKTHTVARGYLIYKDSDGSLRVIYSD